MDMRFDTVIRNGTVVTASDTFECDVGIHGRAHRGACGGACRTPMK